MNLVDGNIKLRALEPEDLDFLFEMENDEDFWQISSTQAPFSKHLLTKYLANAHLDIYQAKQLRLVIDYQNKPIGFIDLFDFNPQHQRAGIGILIAKEYQNKGLGLQVLNLLISYAFNVLLLHQLYADIETDNTASIKLFEKANFKLVGIKKEWNFTKNGYKDEALYQLINKINVTF